MTKIMISLSATAAALKGLERLIKRAAAVYTNDGTYLKVDMSKYPNARALLISKGVKIGQGVTSITDKLFDHMAEVLKEENPASKTLKAVGSPVVAQKGRAPKVKLKHYMGSLDKIKPGTADEWLKAHPGPYIVSDKMDGVSIQLNYDPGKTARLFTRGNGMVGQDITKLLPHLKIPQSLKQALDARGEIIMSDSAFASRWAKEFENARNLASGIVNRKDVHPAIKDIDIVVYDILMPRGTPSRQLGILKKLGFHVVPYTVHETLTASQLSKMLSAHKAKSKHTIDGLVVMQDRKTDLAHGINPNHAVAFKETQDEDVAIVKVKEVIWTASKGNLLKPRVSIEPVRLSGVTLNWATGFNAFFIQNGFSIKNRKKGLPIRSIGPGAMVKIIRSGDVIPHILEVVKGVRDPQMPVEDFTWTKSGADIALSEYSGLSDKKRVTYFFTKLDVEGLRMGTMDKFFNAGLDTILKIVKADKEEFLGIDGIQERTAQKLRDNIDRALKGVGLAALMDASGLFGALGEKRLTLVLKAHPDVLEYDTKDKKGLHDMIIEVAGFKDVLAQQFVMGLPKFKAFYSKLGVTAEKPKSVKATGTAFKNAVVIFTGFRDKAMETKIVQQGGTIGSAINSKATLLVVKDMNAGSTKITKAKGLGIKIMSGALLKQNLDKL